MKYRTDIDGLRALAVVSVILFHLGLLPNGYLGVDVFFVISGYLITSIVYHQSEKGKFSIIHFYERRIRRIIPLLLFITGVALVLGLIYMLPDDLENLSQAVVASNFSANNILMYITSSDYWAVKNEYKPLMHTWSLGIEEQFYMLYPFLFFLFKGEKIRYVKGILIVLTLLSMVAFLLQSNVAASFYFIQYRFFELSIGGLGAILFTNTTIKRYGQGRVLLYTLLALTTLIMYAPILESNTSKVLLTTMLTVGVLITGKQYFDQDRVYQAIMANPVVRFIGNISFSLYMWHQLVFAFARTAFIEEITTGWAVALSLLTLVLSVATYYGIENPFRKPQVMKTRTVLLAVGTAFVVTTGAAFYIYTIGGIVKDYPELNLYRAELGDRRNFFSGSSNIHIEYNEKVKRLDRGFSDTGKTKVLVIGNSFGRDVANVLLESALADKLEVRYFELSRVMTDDSLRIRFEEADRVILGAQGTFGKDFLESLGQAHNFTADRSKVWVFGTKDFGFSNGIHYNNITDETNFVTYRTKMKAHGPRRNRELQEEWGDRYIDILAKLANDEGEILVFTPEGKFMSQDTEHLTKSGAEYIARLFEPELTEILGTDPETNPQ
ncbi:peptidoglycan/LPS O-acetylase OafA/YrhL [Lewinella aquimaris]|uniref:Peptidoglycan/LPS O-acetylase OafA/YrhL n=1 Tax=Neolewinella aquimaris TaxID=1835722 RepID=A0A840E0H4_9BACT|nr:acyltransferase [Neolewinella aquimaris]MBB4079004.1 peptidoglycan/LPS O-acetylase OafA/YrhL [Neolewinella aquimaris]